MPDTGKMVKSGETIRSPYEPAQPIYKGLLDAINQRFTGGQPNLSGLGISTPANFENLAGQYSRLSGSNPVSTGNRLAREYQGLLGPTSAQTNLQSMASNSGVDPNFEAALNYQTDKVGNALNDRFASIGRYGSGDYAKAYGDTIGGVRASALSNQWNQDRQNQLAASGLIDQSNQAQAGARRGILGDLGNVQQTNYGNKLAALGGRLGALQGQTAAQTADIAGRGGIEGLRWGDLTTGGGLLGSLYGPLAGQEDYKQATPIWEKILGGVIGLGGLFGGLPFGQSKTTGFG